MILVRRTVCKLLTQSFGFEAKSIQTRPRPRPMLEKPILSLIVESLTNGHFSSQVMTTNFDNFYSKGPIFYPSMTLKKGLKNLRSELGFLPSQRESSLNS